MRSLSNQVQTTSWKSSKGRWSLASWGISFTVQLFFSLNFSRPQFRFPMSIRAVCSGAWTTIRMVTMEPAKGGLEDRGRISLARLGCLGLTPWVVHWEVSQLNLSSWHWNIHMPYMNLPLWHWNIHIPYMNLPLWHWNIHHLWTFPFDIETYTHHLWTFPLWHWNLHNPSMNLPLLTVKHTPPLHLLPHRH